MKTTLNLTTATFVACLLLAAQPLFSQDWTFYSNDLFGGKINSVFQTGNVHLAGTEQGLFRSTDDGKTWTNVSPAGSQSAAGAFVEHNGKIYTAYQGPIYRSEDQGLTWVAVGQVPGAVTGLAFKGDLFLASASSGVYKSTDFGVSWTKTTGLPDDTWAMEIIVEGSNAVVGMNVGGVFYSSTGDNWIRSGGTMETNADVLDFAQRGGVIYSPGNATLMKSTDEGATWTVATTNSSSPSYARALYAPANSTKLFAAMGSGVMVSNDDGKTWSGSYDVFPTTTEREGVLDITGTSTGGILAAGFAGLFRSDNGVSYTKSDDGITAHEISGVTAINDKIVIHTNAGLFRKENVGWKRIDPASYNAEFMVSYGDSLVVGTLQGGFFLSENAGDSWTGLPSGHFSFWNIPLLATKGRIWATDLNSLYSLDATNQWTAFPVADNFYYSIDQMKENKTHLFYAGTNALFRTDKNNIHWEQKFEQLEGYDRILSIDVVDTTVYISTTNGLFRSTDNGDSWARPDNQPSLYLERIVSDRGYLFATSYQSVLASVDLGASWTYLAEGLPAMSQNFNFKIHNDTIYLGNFSGLFVRPLSDLAPRIDSFTPTQNETGKDVRIEGKNFANDVTLNTVSVNGVAATVKTASSTSLLVTLTPNMKSGPLAVTVNGVTALSAIDLCIGVNPTITLDTSDGVRLKTDSIAGMDISWQLNGTELPNENNASLAVSAEGLYTVKLSAGDCEFVSEETEIIMTSLEQKSSPAMQLRIYPVPARSVLNVDLSSFKADELVSVSISDAMGNLHDREMAQGGNVLHKNVSLAPGIYFVTAKSGLRSLREKILIHQ